jgi:hypothetical protein
MDDLQGRLEIWLRGVSEPVVLLYQTNDDAQEEASDLLEDATDEDNQPRDVLISLFDHDAGYFAFRSSRLVAVRVSKIVR